jgi:hypothetical protein
MLSGILPFHSRIQEEIMTMTLRCNVCLTNAHWSNVSDNVSTLLMVGEGPRVKAALT